uniref:Uncharacterized protein n=1 Tax=Anopheles albimanus TaxID=7167 RepID=A0A182FR74_ANOAL
MGMKHRYTGAMNMSAPGPSRHTNRPRCDVDDRALTPDDAVMLRLAYRHRTCEAHRAAIGLHAAGRPPLVRCFRNDFP